jgi:hypothetical protein
MAIAILETVALHGAEIARFLVAAATRLDGLHHHLIGCAPALGRQIAQHFTHPSDLAQLPGRK